MSMVWVILCSLLKEIHSWQSASLVLSKKLSTPFPVVPARATTFSSFTVTFLGGYKRSCTLLLDRITVWQKSLRLLCLLYSPSKTPTFLCPPLPFRWTRCPSSKNRWISILIPSFLIKDLMATGDWKGSYHRDRATRGQQDDPSRERLSVRMDS